MNYVTDPDLLKHLNGGMGDAPSGASSQQNDPSWGLYNSEDGSVWNTAKAQVSRLADNFAASAIDKESSGMSNYMISRAKKSSAKFMEENDKLGYSGQIAAGVLGYAPVIAAGIANPYVGAGLMGASTTAESLAAQQENGKDYDMNKAVGAGGASAILDLATMGAASKVGNIARNLAKPKSAAIVESVAQPAVSNAGSQVMINLASDRPWDEGVGQAALIGGATGTAIKGTMHGINKALNIPFNKGGEQSVRDEQGIRDESGLDIDPNYSNQVHEFNNFTSALREDIRNKPVTEDSTPDINAFVNGSMKEGSAAALQDAAKLLKQFKVPTVSTMFDFDMSQGIDGTGHSVNVARDLYKIKDTELTKAGEAFSNTKTTLFGRTKSNEAAENTPALSAKFAEKYKEVRDSVINNTKSNYNYIDGLYKGAKTEGSPIISDLQNLKMDLGSYHTMMVQVGKGLPPDMDSLQAVSKRILSQAHKLGVESNFKGVDGTAGTFNPVTNLQTLQFLHKGAHKVNPSVSTEHVNPMKNEYAGSSAGGNVADVLALSTGQLWAPIVRRTATELYRKGTQRTLRKEKAKSDAIIDSLARQPARPLRSNVSNEGMRNGDFNGAARDASADLESMGITVPRTESDVAPVVHEEAPVQTVEEVTPTQAPLGHPFGDVVPMSRGDAASAARMASRPEVRVTTEEPTPIIEESSPVSRGDAELAAQLAARPAPRVEEPTVAPVEAEVAPQLDIEALKQKAIDDFIAANPMYAPQATPKAPRTDLASQPVRLTDENPTVVIEAPRASDAERSALASQPRKLATEEAAPEPTPIVEDTPAPVETVPEKPKAKPSELARKPVQRAIEEHEAKTGKEITPDMVSKYAESKNKLREADNAVDEYSKRHGVDKEDVWDVIEQGGGVEALGRNGKSASTSLNTLFAEHKIKVAKKTKADAENAEKMADDIIEEDIGATREESLNKLGNDLVSKGIDRETITAAKDRALVTIGENYTPTQINNLVKVIAREQAAAAKAEVDKMSKTDKPTVLGKTMAQSKQDLIDYATALEIVGDTRVNDLINLATSSRKADAKGLSESQENAAVRKINDYLIKQRDAYRAAVDTAKTESPAEYGQYVQKLNVWEKRVKKQEVASKLLADKQAEKVKAAKEEVKRGEKAKKEKSDKVDKAEAQVKIADEVATETKARVKAVKSRIEEKFNDKLSDLTPEEMKVVTETLMNKLPTGMNSVEDPAFIKYNALMDVATDALKAAGKTKEAAALSVANKTLEKGLKMKAAFPKDNTLWMSYEDAAKIQDALDGRGGTDSYFGSLFKRLRLAIFEDTETLHLVRFPNRILEGKLKNKLESDLKGDVKDGIGALGIKE